jgi:hypothetical protein
MIMIITIMNIYIKKYTTSDNIIIALDSFLPVAKNWY